MDIRDEHDGAHALSWAQCMELVATRGVGRIAFTDAALPQVLPVNFALDGTSIVFRTASEGRLAATCRGTVVAFEVDFFNLDFHSGWSVLIIGGADAIVNEGDLLRARQLPFAPWPGGHRDHFVRIVPGIVTGRMLSALAV